ncbi:hypothetical protein U1Q18_012055 [Sarracenia purpurea var. burkii]
MWPKYKVRIWLFKSPSRIRPILHVVDSEVLPTLEVKALVIVTLLVDIELSLTEVVSSIGAQTGPATSSLSSSSSAHTNAPYSSFAPSAHSHATNSHASTTSITNSATHGSTTSAPGASSSPSILGPPPIYYPCTPHSPSPPIISLFIPILPQPLHVNFHPMITGLKSRALSPMALLVHSNISQHGPLVHTAKDSCTLVPATVTTPARFLHTS